MENIKIIFTDQNEYDFFIENFSIAMQECHINNKKEFIDCLQNKNNMLITENKNIILEIPIKYADIIAKCMFVIAVNYNIQRKLNKNAEKKIYDLNRAINSQNTPK